MDKNRIDGAAKKIKGTMKEGAGKITGDKVQEAEGKAERVAGAVQSSVGEAADDAKDKAKD